MRATVEPTLRPTVLAPIRRRTLPQRTLPVRLGTRVVRLSRQGGGYRVETTAGTYHADQVVVAMANYQKRRVPDFARELPAGLAADNRKAVR